MHRTNTWERQEACPAALLPLVARQRPLMSLRCVPDCFDDVAACTPAHSRRALPPLISISMEAVSRCHSFSQALLWDAFSPLLHMHAAVHTARL